MALALHSGMLDPRRPERVLKIVFGLVLVLPLLAWLVASAETRRTLASDAREHTSGMADLLHEHALKVFETQELVAEQVQQVLFGLSDAEIVAREGTLWPRLRGISERLAQLQDIWVLDATGHPLIVTNFMPAPRALDLSDRAYFRAHVDGGAPPEGFYISEPLRGRADATRTFFQLSKARRAAGVFQGVTALSIEPAYFASFYASVARNGFAVLSLIRADGTRLAHHRGRDAAAGDTRASQQFLEAVIREPEKGLYTESFSDGRAPHLVAYRKLQGHAAYVVVEFDTAVSEAQWRDQSVAHLYFGLPAVVGLLLLLALALRQNRREYASLMQLQAETLHRRELESQLHHAQRLESLGRLTGGVAHDFNNLLAVVSGSLELLRKRLPPSGDRERRQIDRALMAVERGSLLIRRLLSFARQQPLEPALVNAADILADVAEMARLSVGSSVTVDLAVADREGWMTIDCGQFETAMLNLCVNARDAMPEGGVIRLSCACGEVSPSDASRMGWVPGRCVVIEVADNGQGMSEDVLQKAAEPFFTTKPPGFGTGLGLSQVHGFIAQSGGKVLLNSAPGRGTVVTLHLPRSDPPAAIGPTTEPPEMQRARAGEAILLVDDDPAVRMLTAETLATLGYAVLEADGATAAVATLQAGPQVTAVLTDIMMPGRDGWQLAAEIASFAPSLPIVFMTGYDASQQGDRTGAVILRKPFSMRDLARALRNVLDAEGASARTEDRTN